MAIMIITSYL